ncbi:hypothetical protein D3C83_198100 [compost metagenome]
MPRQQPRSSAERQPLATLDVHLQQVDARDTLGGAEFIECGGRHVNRLVEVAPGRACPFGG